ncbi:hypothetical protein PUR59_26100 [Streptomyces sp. SP18ES09]|uniref:hypothetical protein n=1 Tax=Streptomyces sp. SP18ES09 TaxID=3002532 RepID=UPI002E769D7C|nr:hypothetical protein [Streptomyces sp. SP18ES09]MEE1818479.1 hypothetical protein [Streptomyces sp. SP18ES09]
MDSWRFLSRMFEEASYAKLYDAEFGPQGDEDGSDDWIRTMLPLLFDWRAQLEETRDRLRSVEDLPYRTYLERKLRKESAAYQRALLKLSEAWLSYFFLWQGEGEAAPASLIFDVDGGES